MRTRLETEECEETFVPFCNLDWFLPNIKLQQGALDPIVTVDNFISLIISIISIISVLIFERLKETGLFNHSTLNLCFVNVYVVTLR